MQDPQFRKTPSGNVVAFRQEGGKLVRPRVALIGTFIPRKCGIATFTADLRDSLSSAHGNVDVDVYALDNARVPLDYRGVAHVVPDGETASYSELAERINASGAHAVWLQHEFGIYGGIDGEYVIHLVDRIASPLIVTLHTVLSEPSPRQDRILRHLIRRASHIMVMSQHGHDLLLNQFGADPGQVTIIPHGAPDRPFGREAEFKAKLGLADRPVLMTFGLLSPGKGLERMIEALPAIVARHPEAVYRIVGATHPNCVAEQGEAYREKLRALADELGVADNIVWDGRYLDTPELLDQLEGCDIYVTPYFNMQQSTSGTLSYAVALGKAVVSTPYLHAQELLADGVGSLIEPDSAEAIAKAVIALLDEPSRLADLKRRAYQAGRATIWPRFAEAAGFLVRQVAVSETVRELSNQPPSMAAVLAMTDGTGMLQHSIGIVPDRAHGYCLDDNVRALMVMNLLPAAEFLTHMRTSLTYASFVQSAWNPDRRRFRNFMRYDRQWAEEEGSEDSNGRAIWSIGHTIEHAADPDLRDWARRLFTQVALGALELGSPRARAFCVLGACAALRAGAPDPITTEIVLKHGSALAQLLAEHRQPDWCWFEPLLAYDNARLPQALIEAGHILGNKNWLQEGLAALAWINSAQTGAHGQFRPVGSETFGQPYVKLPFDQQPLEAQAAIEANLSAMNASPSESWHRAALTAWRWFFGVNDRGVAIAEPQTGRCYDGLTPRGANINTGAESILAYHLSFHAMSRMASSKAAGTNTGLNIASQFTRQGEPSSRPTYATDS